MDFDAKSSSIDERLANCLKDSADVIHRISNENPKKGSTVELVTELPATTDVDILIGMVLRWREIASLFECKLRIYAWCYTEEVEKWILQCVQNSPNLFVTVLPMVIKKGYLYE